MRLYVSFAPVAYCFDDATQYANAFGPLDDHFNISGGIGMTVTDVISDGLSVAFVALPTSGNYSVKLENLSSSGGQLRGSVVADAGGPTVQVNALPSVVGPNSDTVLNSYTPPAGATRVSLVITNQGRSAPDTCSNQQFRASTGAPQSAVAVSNVAVSGPTAGFVNTSYTFTGTVTPATASDPITYVWQATGQNTITNTSGSSVNTVSFRWPSGGTQAITVTASNSAGSATSSQVINISDVAPGSVSLSGSTNSVVNKSESFIATVSPANASTPMTYVWEATGQTAVTNTGGITNLVTFNWSTEGTQVVTVTVSNAAGSKSATLNVNVGGSATAPAAVVITGTTSGVVGVSYSFTATVGPANTTEPLTYVWQASGQNTVTNTNGTLNNSVSFTWSSAGAKSILVLASNTAGSSTGTFTVTITVPNNPVPIILSLNPMTATAGSGALDLLVDGTNFLPSSVVRVNGADRPTTVTPHAPLVAHIPASDLASPGTLTITVFNPGPGGGESNTLTLTITSRRLYLPLAIR